MSSESARNSVSISCFARAATPSRRALVADSRATIAGTSSDVSSVAIFWQHVLRRFALGLRLLRPRGRGRACRQHDA